MSAPVKCPNCKGSGGKWWPFGPCTICRGTGRTAPEKAAAVRAARLAALTGEET